MGDECAGGVGVGGDVAIGVVDGEVGVIVAEDELETSDTTCALEGAGEVEAPGVVN